MKKVILVTGASSGFGFDLVKALLEKDQIVYGAARNIEAMQPLKELGAHILKMDVTQDQSVENGIKQIINEQKVIDVVFNNAGYGSYGVIEDISIDELKYQYDVNVFGVARVTKQVLPFMRSQKSGRIVMTSSLSSHLPTKVMGWYSATKFSIRSMSVALRQEVKQFGIDVVQIEPGIVKTAFEDVAIKALDKTAKGSAYQTSIEGAKGYLQKSYKNGPDSTSTVNAMVKAALSKRPKYVYRTTFDSKILPVLLKFMPAKLSDFLIGLNFSK